MFVYSVKILGQKLSAAAERAFGFVGVTKKDFTTVILVYMELFSE